jgi:hypothetical protein
MALVPVVTMAFGASTVSITDATGTYDALTNVTGYGSPNAEFSDYAHYAIIRKKNVNEVADSVLVLTSYDPTVATSFSAPRTVDGWYEGKKLNILIWTAGTYAADIVKYHGGVVYKANTSTSEEPGVGSEWDVVSDLTTIEANASVIVTTIGRVTPYNADVYWSRKQSLYAQQGRNGLTLEDKAQARQETIYKKIQQVLVADQLGLDTDGEWIVLDLIEMGAV